MPSLENDAANGASGSEASTISHAPTSGCGAVDGAAASVVSVAPSVEVAGASVEAEAAEVAGASDVPGASLAGGASVVPGASVSAGASVVTVGSVDGTVSGREQPRRRTWPRRHRRSGMWLMPTRW